MERPPTGDDQPPPEPPVTDRAASHRSLAWRGWLNRQLQLLARIFGTTIRDARSGEVLGKALIFPWRGRLMVIAYTGHRYFYPRFRMQERATYWKQEIEFYTHPDPDEPHVRDPQSDSDPPAA
ncbi:MAG: hypothetical protein AAGK14_11405 [Verrucomicrobiota bacterium]